jgi:hypothetical protein
MGVMIIEYIDIMHMERMQKYEHVDVICFKLRSTVQAESIRRRAFERVRLYRFVGLSLLNQLEI